MDDFELTVRVKVFPDPEFCEKHRLNCCRFMKYTAYYRCQLFTGQGFEEGYGLLLEKDEETLKVKKCPECKEAYQKQKEINESTKQNS